MSPHHFFDLFLNHHILIGTFYDWLRTFAFVVSRDELLKPGNVGYKQTNKKISSSCSQDRTQSVYRDSGMKREQQKMGVRQPQYKSYYQAYLSRDGLPLDTVCA